MDNYVRNTNCNTPDTLRDRTRYELPDIHVALVEKRAIDIDGFIVDRDTGEILGEYVQAPASHALSCPRPHRAPDEVLSVDEWDDYIRQHVDRRKLPPHTTHVLYTEQDAALGEYFRKGGDYRISMPMMNLLLQLHELVRYRNVIIMTQADLAKHLEVVESNLSAKLAKLVDAGLLKVFTARNGNMRKGEIKLLINPTLVFRGSDPLQERAVETWYQHQMQRDSQVREYHRMDTIQTAA